MRKFRVQVNGNAYDVEVEEVGSSHVSAAAPQAAAVPEPPARADVQQKAAPKVASPSSGVKVIAPMPGTITDVKVKPGDKVAPNTVVVMLEAMKMENEIFAGKAGVVSHVAVSKGASVNTGDLLAMIDPA